MRAGRLYVSPHDLPSHHPHTHTHTHLTVSSTHLNLCSKGERGHGSSLAEGESNGRREGGGVDIVLRLLLSLHAVVGAGALPSHLASSLQGRTTATEQNQIRQWYGVD